MEKNDFGLARVDACAFARDQEITFTRGVKGFTKNDNSFAKPVKGFGRDLVFS